MHRLLFLIAALAAAPAAAQKPPPLGAPDLPSAKPPPLGTLAPARPLPPIGERAKASGTGFIVAAGRVLTNNHVVEGCGRMTARNAAGQRVPARVDATDTQRDLALLTVPAGFGPALAFRDKPPVERGETVVTLRVPALRPALLGPHADHRRCQRAGRAARQPAAFPDQRAGAARQFRRPAFGCAGACDRRGGVQAERRPHRADDRRRHSAERQLRRQGHRGARLPHRQRRAAAAGAQHRRRAARRRHRRGGPPGDPVLQRYR